MSTCHRRCSALPAGEHAGLPQGLLDTDVSALLTACDPMRLSGRRDRAIVLLLVRLGLRRAEVARLEVGDIDWRAGEFTVTGKGNRLERLPLPVDVGQALVDYLRLDRPLARSQPGQCS